MGVNMKKLIYGALFGLILTVVMLTVGANTNSAPVLTYVYSNSMEPLIKVNDAFIVLPAKQLEVSDIITFRPIALKAAYITHRIVAIGQNGFITKGDNSPYQDQEGIEPEVTADRIVGKVLTMNGQPLVFPGLGKFSASIKKHLGSYTRYFAVVFLVLGVWSAAKENHIIHKRKPRHRLRLYHIYRWATVIAVSLVVISIYLGSRVVRISYFVSEYPNKQGNQIEVRQPGQVNVEVWNNGIIPVWTIYQGIEPLSIHEAKDFLWLRSKATIKVDVHPQYSTGNHNGYIQMYHYPTLLPRALINYLHQLHPFFAIIATGIVTGFYFALLFKLLNYIHGLEGWIPMKAIKDKIASRRLKRMKANFFSRKRGRY
jgi:signal peptidase